MTSGPLTRDDLEAVWRDANDEGYWRPLRDNLESGVEAHDQAAEQMLRVSVAVDRSTQACYIFPWSGQTDVPASGGQQAIALLDVARVTGNQHLVLESGLTILHTTTDYGPDGGHEVTTGRRYLVINRVVLLPGSVQANTLTAAEKVGTGYNLPQPGTISKILQFGSAFSNLGRVLSNNVLQIAVGPGDVLAPAHVKSYIEITSGPNVGQRRRIVEYLAGPPASLQLDDEWLFEGTLTGVWESRERVVQATTGARGLLVAHDGQHLVIESVSGLFTLAGGPITGEQSGASFQISRIAISGPLQAGDATWRLLDWVSDLGVSVSNPISPVGGRLPMLDEIGEERGIPRTDREPDSVYREHVGNPADVVSPNAIRRTVNRILSPYGVGCCFRQVGGPLLPGLFYDHDAYDLPKTGPNRFKFYLDWVHFRAYFVIGIPPITIGEFGFAYGSPTGFYDVRMRRGNFYDGYPVGTRRLKAAIKAAVDRARMAGVNWDLYTERVGCF